jgi:DNA-directed RNA polymerase subunit beta'
MIGAEAIRELLKGLELEKLEGQLRAEMQETDPTSSTRSSPSA